MAKLFNGKYIILDGGMGTLLQRSGMPAGMSPEAYTLAHPEVVENIHKAYIDAGSNIICSCTFNSNRKKLAPQGLEPDAVIEKAVALAKNAAGDRALVAQDIGPLGELLEPAGALGFDEAYELFKEQIIAGDRAGADIIFFETFTDLAELRIGILAARENSGRPIFASMSFEESGRSFTGSLAESFAITASGLGVAALGVNCSLGPEKLMPVLQKMAELTDLPLILKPNAGIPDARDGHYDLTADLFAEEMSQALRISNVTLVGGCCGTTPEYIAKIAPLFAQKAPKTQKTDDTVVLCSASHLARLDMPRIIGERINPTGKKRFQEALRAGDMSYVLNQGIEQAEAGAEILDVNVGVPGIDEIGLMQQVITGLSGVCDLPLQIDSNDPAVIEAGLRRFCGKAIINSVNGEEAKLSAILPLAKKYGTAVVGLTVDEKGIPETAGERFAIAGRIIEAAEKAGIARRNIFIDCLCMTVSANQSAAAETLKAVKMVKEAFGVHCVLGVSNVSFGLPNRELVNRSFLALALENGLDLPIMNPNVASMTDTVFAYRLLRGYDTGCERFIEKYAVVTAAAPVKAAANDIHTAIGRGLSSDAAAIAKAMLAEKAELEIVNDYLIPALDAVGERFERGEIFLPQLIRSADAAGAAFDVIKASLAAKGSADASKGKIVIATVQGDVHDIGKNIVKTVLSNYGYEVIDLGKDVAPEAVLQAVKRENAPLVGLSALMTTTLPAMKKTISLIKADGHPCKIMVGGAVLTAEYAREIGADFYASDAKASADIAKKVLG